MFHGEGDPCERHPAHPKRFGWGILECRECERERIESCVCKGSGTCLACTAERTRTGDAKAKCGPDCSALCHVCNPDD